MAAYSSHENGAFHPKFSSNSGSCYPMLSRSGFSDHPLLGQNMSPELKKYSFSKSLSNKDLANGIVDFMAPA